MSITRTRAGAAVLMLAGVGAFGLQAPAAAHHKPGHSGGPGTNCTQPQYPPKQCNPETASVNDSTLTRGQSFRFFGQGFMPSRPLAITMYSTPVPMGTATADSFTFFEKELAVPANAALGSHRIVAVGLGADSQPLTLTVPVTVVSSGAVGAGGGVDTAGPGGGTGNNNSGIGGLPRTGAEVAAAMLTGLVLLSAGTAAVVAGRRRRQTFA